MSKSKEIAELLNAEITRTVHLDVMHHEAAAHILAQEAEIERLEQAEEASKEVFGQIVDQKKDVEKRLSDVRGTIQSQQSVIAAMKTERDQARDALRVCVEALERMLLLWDRTRESGALPMDYVRCHAAIKQAKEALK